MENNQEITWNMIILKIKSFDSHRDHCYMKVQRDRCHIKATL